MPHEVVKNIEELSGFFSAQAGEAEDLGCLPEETVQTLKRSGIVRMLQPEAFGGYQADPRDFYKAVMATAAQCGASGWVSGIVGVHTWEMAIMPEDLQKEIWGTDPDTWIASPYALLGKARPVEGGFVLSGRWPFSSGTDHCQWAWLGARVVDEHGAPLDPPCSLHVVLPRGDYTIVDDSWDVVGLRGTGSKDVQVDDVFIPVDRTVEVPKVLDGTAAREAGRSEPLYRMPWSAVFPNAITAAVIGACQGVLALNIEYQRSRVNHFGGIVREDPYVMAAISESASEIHSASLQMMDNLGRMLDLLERNQEIPFELRAQTRRDQVRGSWRAVQAMDVVFSHAGGNALRMSNPMQRLWRDAHAGLHHAINICASPYRAFAASSMGAEVAPGDRAFI